MLVQCPGCRELVTLAVFDARDGVLSFTCGACGQAQRVASGVNAPLRAATTLPPPSTSMEPRAVTSTPRSSAPPAPVPPVPASPASDVQALPALPPPASDHADAPPTVETPAPRPPARKHAAEMANAVAPAPGDQRPEGAPPSLWNAWVTLCGKWSIPGAHDAFIATCAAADALPFAGLRYRDHLAAHPGEPMATRGRDRVLAQAMIIAQSRAESARPLPAAPGRNVKIISWVLTAAAAAGGTYMLLDARRKMAALEAATMAPADLDALDALAVPASPPPTTGAGDAP